VARERITDAAGRVFARYGVEKTTVTDIVREARVGRATFYKWFGGREEVFRAVLEMEISDMLRQVRAAAAAGGDTRTRLLRVLLTYTFLMREKLNLYRVTLESLVEMMPIGACEGEVRQLVEEFRDLYRGILEDGARAGEIRVEDAAATARVLLLVFKGLFIGTVTGEIGEDRERVMKAVVDMVMDGMRPREARA